MIDPFSRWDGLFLLTSEIALEKVLVCAFVRMCVRFVVCCSLDEFLFFANNTRYLCTGKNKNNVFFEATDTITN